MKAAGGSTTARQLAADWPQEGLKIMVPGLWPFLHWGTPQRNV